MNYLLLDTKRGAGHMTKPPDYPQAGGPSERTNQTLEIALRHWSSQRDTPPPTHVRRGAPRTNGHDAPSDGD
ncbi:hypothetical protein N7527_008293 [Penicillium freii]|nr:hypothetical protein N7527_008293 [Penicillium freii]